ncbi:MAG: tol-pal system protein YbgF [Deltaproteobacteria bacterium]|nr:tol-pal system protein YbgF [Deltaproteobacteria bacterium]
MIEQSILKEFKIKMARLIFSLAIFLSLLTGGCLTRTANPSLPYTKPVYSAGGQDANSAVAVSKIQDMEAELRKMRDSLERLEASGGDRSIKELQERIAQIERQLGIDNSQKSQTGGQEGSRKAISADSTTDTTNKDNVTGKKASTAASAIDQSDEVTEVRNMPLTPDEKAYRAAYATFKSGALENAVSQFQDFLKKAPKSPFAPNAVYWIGEIRLEQGRFEEAVLLFDRVIKEYPGSKKELSAQLKQGQAFEKMGDNRSAKIIFQKIVKNYPHTAHGRIAAARLKSLASSTD